MKSTFAIHAAVPAIPAKPKIPAMIAIIRNIIAHDNMCFTSRIHYRKPFKTVPEKLIGLRLNYVIQGELCFELCCRFLKTSLLDKFITEDERVVKKAALPHRSCRLS